MVDVRSVNDWHFIDKLKSLREGIISKETAGQNNESQRIPRSANNWFLAFLQLFALWNTTCCGQNCMDEILLLRGWMLVSLEKIDIGKGFLVRCKTFKRASRLGGFTIIVSISRWGVNMMVFNTFPSIYIYLYICNYITSHNLVQEEHNTSPVFVHQWIWKNKNKLPKVPPCIPNLRRLICMGFGSFVDCKHTYKYICIYINIFTVMYSMLSVYHIWGGY